MLTSQCFRGFEHVGEVWKRFQGIKSYLKRTPHPFIVTRMGDKDYFKVLLYSYYTTIKEWGSPPTLPFLEAHGMMIGLYRVIQGFYRVMEGYNESLQCGTGLYKHLTGLNRVT